jgi:group I intron endonuclease
VTETEIERPANLPGIYAIVNTVTRKRYVGSTVKGFRSRWAEHQYRLKANTHGNKYLQLAWNKYGPKSFVFIILEQCKPEKCLELEQKWMDHYRVVDRKYGYNSRPKAESNLGKKFGPLKESHRKKIITKLLGRPVSHETRIKLAKANTGKQHSPETRLRMSLVERSKGWTHTAETRSKISQTRSKLIEEGLLKISGHPHTEEAKLKISASKRGKRMNEISIRKMAKSKLGVPWSSARRAAQFPKQK